MKMYLNFVFKTFSLKTKLKIIKRFSSSTTIYSLSTNIRPTGSAIAVIRISGHKAFNALPELIQNKTTINNCRSNPRKAFFTKLYDIKSNELMDSSLVICFKKPFTYTGEDMCELHIHGSNAVISGVLGVLSRIDGFRPAEAGELTRRALINDKLDLIQVEAINDLIKSQTQSQRRRALSAINGSVTQLYDNWRQELIKLLANIEVFIDFGEEELIEESVFNNLKQEMNVLLNKIEKYLNNCKNKSDLITDGLKVSIIGSPNAGKSTLINTLCERDLSIVSPISGTTRDIVETWLNIGGYSVSISDTAGIKGLDIVSDDIEREGIKRAIKRAEESDLILYVIDSTALIGNDFESKLNPNYLKSILKSEKEIIYCINKTDLISKDKYNYLQQKCHKLSNHWFLISCKTSHNFDDFLKLFVKRVEQLCGNPLMETLFTTSRHEAHLKNVVQQIGRSIETLDEDIAVSAHHLREAAQQLSYITGRITTEDVLDVIFKDFCIGK